jgi:NAD(P)-dependent dehydrogenase (short-subunit alcohol dehydrogenase family)
MPKSNALPLRGRSALISGGTGDIGRAIARRFLVDGGYTAV